MSCSTTAGQVGNVEIKQRCPTEHGDRVPPSFSPVGVLRFVVGRLIF